MAPNKTAESCLLSIGFPLDQPVIDLTVFRQSKCYEILWDQSGFAPENLTTFAHLSVSSLRSFANPAGESASAVPPSTASRCLTCASASAALISLLSRSTITAGVFLGATTPNHELAS